jgi:hypothetical protein
VDVDRLMDSHQRRRLTSASSCCKFAKAIPSRFMPTVNFEKLSEIAVIFVKILHLFVPYE